MTQCAQEIRCSTGDNMSASTISQGIGARYLRSTRHDDRDPAWLQAQAQFNRDYDVRNYMIDGVWMTFEQFLDQVAPGDSPMRTFLTLKYKNRSQS